jgi:hypothetical protein
MGNPFRSKPEDYLYDSIEDLHNNRREERLTELDIDAGTWYARIGFARMWAKLDVSSGETSSAGISYKLDRVISNAARTPKLFYNGWFMWIMALLISPLVNIIFTTPVRSSRSYFYTLAGLLVLMPSWLLWALSVRLRRHAVIVLTHKSSEKSFFQRNRDNLILALISALLGATL